MEPTCCFRRISYTTEGKAKCWFRRISYTTEGKAKVTMALTILADGGKDQSHLVDADKLAKFAELAVQWGRLRGEYTSRLMALAIDMCIEITGSSAMLRGLDRSEWRQLRAYYEALPRCGLRVAWKK